MEFESQLQGPRGASKVAAFELYSKHRVGLCAAALCKEKSLTPFPRVDFYSATNIMTQNQTQVEVPDVPDHSTLELVKHDQSVNAPERDHALVAPENGRQRDAPEVHNLSCI